MPQGALFDPYDSATPYRQGAQDDHALNAALRRSLAEQHRGSSDAEEHLRSAIAASLEVSPLLSRELSTSFLYCIIGKDRASDRVPYVVPITSALTGDPSCKAIRCCSLFLARVNDAHVAKV